MACMALGENNNQIGVSVLCGQARIQHESSKMMLCVQHRRLDATNHDESKLF